MAGGSQESGRSVTSKVLGILEVFETTRRSMSLTEISAHSGLPLSTTHRLVGELVDWGFLSRGPTGRIQLGLRLWAIAQNAGRQLRETARPFVQDLFSLTGETSQLVVRDGVNALYIDRVYGSKRIPRASRVGGRLPLHATACGKVLLAYEEDWVRQGYLQRTLQQPTLHTHANPERLATELSDVRAQGYATTFEEMRLGLCSIAVPVFHTGKIGCSIGLVLPAGQASAMNRHLPVLNGIAAQIQRATAHIPLETLLGSIIDPLPPAPPEH